MTAGRSRSVSTRNPPVSTGSRQTTSVGSAFRRIGPLQANVSRLKPAQRFPDARVAASWCQQTGSAGAQRWFGRPLEAPVSLDEAFRVLAFDRFAELLLDHGGVCDGFRRKVVVRVEIQLLDERPRRIGDVGELRSSSASTDSRSGPRPFHAATSWRRFGRAAACSRSRARSADSSVESKSGTSARRSGPRRRRRAFRRSSVSPKASLQLRCRSSTATG